MVELLIIGHRQRDKQMQPLHKAFFFTFYRIVKVLQLTVQVFVIAGQDTKKYFVIQMEIMWK